MGKTHYRWKELKGALEGGEDVFGFKFVCSHKITFLHEDSKTEEEYKTTWYTQISNAKDILASLTFHFSGAPLTRYGATNKVSDPDTLMIEYYQEYTKVLEFGLPSPTFILSPVESISLSNNKLIILGDMTQIIDKKPVNTSILTKLSLVTGELTIDMLVDPNEPLDMN